MSTKDKDMLRLAQQVYEASGAWRPSSLSPMTGTPSMTALSMTLAIVKLGTCLLIQACENLEDEKGFEALNSAPIITKLMPHILASISSLATSDPSSAVFIL